MTNDALELIKNKFKKDKFAKYFGIQLDEITEDFVQMHMLLTPEMNNFQGRPHGAAIYGLADAAFSVIGNNKNNICVALDCSITYHASPDPGEVLYVRGELVKQTRRIGTYMFSLYTLKDNNEHKVATMISTLYCTGKPHDPNIKC
ncbi:MAG: hotdog fold thioesterase [Candidatus Lokiarchaeota archaeon]|nr:hotdog fold thioesterase [Candidatus Lokiarchaeota archaeon]MBD3339294.1 hotdog fold thioesterase [Candidatus Lokiarchaeota archaeon]